MKESDFWITGNNVANNFSFLQRPIVYLQNISPGVRGINSVLPDMLFLLWMCGSCWIAFYESPWTTVSSKTLLYCSTEEKTPIFGWAEGELTGEMFIFGWTMPLIQQSTSYTQNRNRLEEAAVKLSQYWFSDVHFVSLCEVSPAFPYQPTTIRLHQSICINALSQKCIRTDKSHVFVNQLLIISRRLSLTSALVFLHSSTDSTDHFQRCSTDRCCFLCAL